MKRYFKRILLATLVPILVLAFALVVLDFGFLRGPIERSASRALDRSFTIDGDLSIRLGSITTLRAGNVRIGNPEWLPAGNFLHIEHLDLRLETAKLWQEGPVAIQRLVIEGAQLHLVENIDGRANWIFETKPGEPSAAQPAPLPFLLREFRLTGLDVELQSFRLANPVRAHVEQFSQDLDPAGLARLSLKGRIDDEPLSFDGSAGPWNHLGSGHDVLIEGKGTLGLSTFGIESRFDSLFAPRRPEIHLVANSPSLAHLTETLGLGDWGDGAVWLDLQTRDEDDLLTTTANAEIGRLSAEFQGRMDSLTDFEQLSVHGSASGPNLGLIARLAGHPGWPERPFEFEIELQRDAAALTIDRLNLGVAETVLRVAGEIPAMPSLVGADLSLDLSGEELRDFNELAGIGELPAGPFRINGKIGQSQGKRTEVDLTFNALPANGMLRGFLASDETFELQLILGGPDLASLNRLDHLSGVPSGPFRIDGHIAGASTGTRYDFEFIAPPGEGHVTAELQKNDRFRLDLDMGGALANRLGAIIGVQGLPEAPWTIRLGLDRAANEAFDIRSLDFETAGMSLTASGRLDTESPNTRTRLAAALKGPDMSVFQGLVPDRVTLLAEPFDVQGTIASNGLAWLLEGVRARLGPTSIGLNGQVGTRNGFVGTRLELTASGAKLGALLDLPGSLRLPEGPFESRVDLFIDEQDIQIENYRLDTGALSLRFDATAPWPLDLSHGRFDLDARGQNISRILPELAGLELEPLSYEASGKGSWSDDTINIEGLQFTLGESSAVIQGSLDLPPDASATDLTLAIKAPNLSRIATLGGTRYGELPFELETHLAGSPDQMELTRLKARLGESDIRASFTLDLKQQPPAFDLKLTTETLDLRPILLGKKTAPESTGAKSVDDGRVIPDTPLPLSYLDFANGTFAIAANELIGRRMRLVNNLISGSLQDGELRINELGVDTSGGRLNISLDVMPEEAGSARVLARIHSKNLILDFSDAPLEEKRKQPPFNIDLDLEARGSTLRELAATLNGGFAIHSPGGKVVNSSNLDMKSHLLAQVVMAVSPSTTLLPEIEIVCFAAVAKARNGVVSLDPGIALQSARINTFSTGTIDLNSEKLNLGVESRTRSLVTISAGELVSPFVKVGGTLADPSIGIDAKGTLLTGGAAVLSGGLSLLAQKALGQLDNEDPCGRILKAADPVEQP